MTSAHNPTALHWERSSRGVLFLRRSGPVNFSVGLVIPNKDGSFSWKTPRPDRPSEPPSQWPANGHFQTEDLAIQGLYAALGI